MSDEEFDRYYDQVMASASPELIAATDPARFSSPKGRVDVPFTIGKRR